MSTDQAETMEPTRTQRKLAHRRLLDSAARDRAADGNAKAQGVGEQFARTLFDAGVPEDFVRKSLVGQGRLNRKSAATILAAWPAEKARRESNRAKAEGEAKDPNGIGEREPMEQLG